MHEKIKVMSKHSHFYRLLTCSFGFGWPAQEYSQCKATKASIDIKKLTSDKAQVNKARLHTGCHLYDKIHQEKGKEAFNAEFLAWGAANPSKTNAELSELDMLHQAVDATMSQVYLLIIHIA